MAKKSLVEDMIGLFKKLFGKSDVTEKNDPLSSNSPSNMQAYGENLSKQKGKEPKPRIIYEKEPLKKLLEYSLS